MTPRGSGSRPRNRDAREHPFTPRSINPIEIQDVLVLAAAEEIRNSKQSIESQMPWTSVKVLANPVAMSTWRSCAPTVALMDEVALRIVDTGAMRRGVPNLVVVLLSTHPLVQCSPPAVARKEHPYTAKADLVFAMDAGDCAPARIAASVVRAAEDHLNIERWPDLRRFVFLVVDDEPRWFSQFLPVLYQVIGQRAAVKLARTYEEAIYFLFGVEEETEIGSGAARAHADDVVCLITDVYFPKGGSVCSEAGRDLVSLVGRHHPRIPVIIASKAGETEGLGTAGLVLPKGDPGFLALLRNYVRDRTGIGEPGPA